MRKRIAMIAMAAALAFMTAPSAPSAPQTPAPRVVEVTAKRFEFTPKEIRLRKGEPVTLRLRSEDVTHGFFARPLKLDLDIPPGKTTEATITPQEAGTFTVICDRYCGSGHAGMHLRVVVE